MNRDTSRRLNPFAAFGFVLALSFSANLCGQTPEETAWDLLESGVKQNKTEERVIAVRVLSLVPQNSHALNLAEKALIDPKSEVRTAAATALGQMKSPAAAPKLEQALNDKDLHVVLAAAHALALLKDPACYEVYYAILTGQRRGNESFFTEQSAVLHDPKKLEEIGFGEAIGFVPFASTGWGALEAIMKDRKEDTAAKAGVILALANDPDARTADVVVTYSHDDNWVLRVAALEALAKRGDPSLLLKIEKSLDDPKDEVKYTCAAAVAHLAALAKVHKTNQHK